MKKALIADDSPALIMQLQQLLQELDVEAEVYDQHRYQLTAASKCGVIFVELVQGKGNGFELLRELAKKADCPLVLLSGTARTSDVAWARRAGAAAVLPRPVNRSRLLNCLQQLEVLPAASGSALGSDERSGMVADPGTPSTAS